MSDSIWHFSALAASAMRNHCSRVHTCAHATQIHVCAQLACTRGADSATVSCSGQPGFSSRSQPPSGRSEMVLGVRGIREVELAFGALFIPTMQTLFPTICYYLGRGEQEMGENPSDGRSGESG